MQVGSILDVCHHQVKSEWMSDVFCARWLKPSWENSRWLSSSSSVRMNEFESEWISLSQSQSGGRVFLSESERRKQGVLNSTIQKLNPRWQNSRWQNSRWPPSSSWVRMNEWSFLVQMLGREVWVKFFFVQMVGTNLGKYECVWEEKLRWLNPRWWNSWWLPSSS